LVSQARSALSFLILGEEIEILSKPSQCGGSHLAAHMFGLCSRILGVSAPSRGFDQGNPVAISFAKHLTFDEHPSLPASWISSIVFR
jgi:hypothetical protein